MEGNRGFIVLEINDISAVGLDCVTTMDVYAEVSVNGDRSTAQRTFVDRDSRSEPKRRSPMIFTIDKVAAHQKSFLFFLLKSPCETVENFIGVAVVPIKELIDGKIGNENAEQYVSYGVRLFSGNAEVALSFSCEIAETFNGAGPSSRYPPPAAYPPATAYGYPPAAMYPQQATAYGYPPAAMYPQQSTAYGYPPAAMYPPPGTAYGSYGYPPAAMYPPSRYPPPPPVYPSHAYQQAPGHAPGQNLRRILEEYLKGMHIGFEFFDFLNDWWLD